MQTQIRDLAARFARVLPEFSLTLSSEGAGNAGRRCAAAKSVHVVATVTPESPGIPRAMVLRFPSSSCVRKICQNVRTGGSHQPPVAGSEPVRARRPRALPGSVGQIRCLPQPEQLHGLRARTEQGRELNDGTK